VDDQPRAAVRGRLGEFQQARDVLGFGAQARLELDGGDPICV